MEGVRFSIFYSIHRQRRDLGIMLAFRITVIRMKRRILIHRVPDSFVRSGDASEIEEGSFPNRQAQLALQYCVV